MSFLCNLRVVFLPANTTSPLQPFDAGIPKNAIHFHQKYNVRRFLARVSHGDDPEKLSLLDTVHYLSISWDSVTSETISNCCRKCGFHRHFASEDTKRSKGDPVACASDIDDGVKAEFLSTGTDARFTEFVSIDDNVPNCEFQSVAEIAAEVVGGAAAKEARNKAPKDSGDNQNVHRPANFAEALAGLDALQSFFCTKNNENVDEGLRCVQELFLSKGERQQQKIVFLEINNVFCPYTSV
ncbi:hypothetical protein HPB51_013566 [Rhipicephalus microplus]|uniref:DDE-1 domain-containing protein n=1 Tax=Rhipicephalus microplus TaxID=6941 RepID=A0A9J6DAK6_RHIMP|nr:hypothetical protein HPB51_013566 [Rhipicephalus microplus]